MATVETLRLPAPHEKTSARILRAIAKTPLQILLAVIGLLWLVPTIGQMDGCISTKRPRSRPPRAIVSRAPRST